MQPANVPALFELDWLSWTKRQYLEQPLVVKGLTEPAAIVDTPFGNEI